MYKMGQIKTGYVVSMFMSVLVHAKWKKSESQKSHIVDFYSTRKPRQKLLLLSQNLFIASDELIFSGETTVHISTSDVEFYPVVSKKYPHLTGTSNETIRYYYSPSGQLNVSFFNLGSQTLQLKIVHQTPEIKACKVESNSAPETRGFENGPYETPFCNC